MPISVTRFIIAVFAVSFASAGAPVQSDIVIYGCTSGAITAAIQAQRMGKSVQIVCPERHLGGLTAGGLGFTDSGNKAVIGGLSRDFYHRVWQHYDKPEAWRWQKREQYGNKGQGTEAIDKTARTMWIFEPHVAEQVYEAWVKETKIPIVRNAWLDREKGVKKQDGRIVSITTLDGKTYSAKMFIDATYEGDLMAAAGVDYHVGRESTSAYGEKWNGVQTGVLHHRHHFGAVKTPISPYVIPGDPKSGVLPRISTEPPGELRRRRQEGTGLLLPHVPHPGAREPRARFRSPLATTPRSTNSSFASSPPAGARPSTSSIQSPTRRPTPTITAPSAPTTSAAIMTIPDASYDRRRELIQEHSQLSAGLAVLHRQRPAGARGRPHRVRQVGPGQRRIQGQQELAASDVRARGAPNDRRYVMTENELTKKRPTPESVGMGSYGIDSHNIQRYITPEGYVQNEGDIGVSTNGPYQISYGSLVPKKGQVSNLLVPVCLSSSHIAYGSIRMEPVFMILGQSAATAAAMAIDSGIAVQDVPYDKLRARLLADGQVLEYQK